MFHSTILLMSADDNQTNQDNNKGEERGYTRDRQNYGSHSNERNYGNYNERRRPYERDRYNDDRNYGERRRDNWYRGDRRGDDGDYRSRRYDNNRDRDYNGYDRRGGYSGRNPYDKPHGKPRWTEEELTKLRELVGTEEKPNWEDIG